MTPSDNSPILAVLDDCCTTYTFPMLDNGYVYLAATRLSLFRSAIDWAMVIEVFGFSPRAGLPDTHIHTFASRLHDRDPPERYATPRAYENYLASNPHNDSRFIHPIAEGPWQDTENPEYVAMDATGVGVRGESRALPTSDAYTRSGVSLEDPARVQAFELCRVLADTCREQVLATPNERRVSVPPELSQLLQLEEWHHPDVVSGEKPSKSETFLQLAEVLVTGNGDVYRPSRPPNTHWRNWPDGGRL